ncbi:heparinase II/III family protein [Photobacterium sp. BZF1]|uniref:heparinase II/III domain-containing protein n=1 Tax=Photobacterium sp. BZF1 TaxID=1904457 RepID=UPI0016536B02|nr:heparinase II/III family protein [Photobacterium sp. BZF1]MBC7005365.1 heparinase II/III family protein [Photobacterium sp. BZF1]
MNTTTLPVLLTNEEASDLHKEIGSSSLMGHTIAKLQAELEQYMALPMDVPGQSEAGGYEHNKHRQNYHYINLAGRLFLITKDERYAKYAGQLLTQYADKYLQLDFHVQRNTNPPGRLFHQMLNEHMWLMYASLGYSCISAWLSDSQRDHIVENLFKPMLTVATEKYDFDFDRIHNHGIWAVAAAGICGLAIGERKYVEMAVYGLNGDGKTGGFLAQLSELFSPSGYYIEGPYYHRFAIRPLAVFAEVLHRHMPELDIYNYKDQVIKKTTHALLATAYPNGLFPALNDASKSMGITDMGVVVAVSMVFKRYGFDENLLGMAQIQDQVWMHPCGLSLSQACDAEGNIEQPFWPSVELNEGPDGNSGAQGFLRMQAKDKDICQLSMNYGQHGMGHGHFDTLGIAFYNRGQEVLREYGFARWVNIEPKFGGRYLDENKSYARQTINHNSVTVDEGCQNQFDVNRADSVHGKPHFFMGEGAELQAMSAFADEHYPGTGMQRTVMMLKSDALESPLLIDLYRLTSDKPHQYDYSHQYQGQIIRTDFDYKANTELHPLGDDYGYQHLWNLARGEAGNSALISWLQGNSYYTWLGTSSSSDNEVIFTQTGANDPQFNLRHETSFIMRTTGKDLLFASALETHGYFNEAVEASVDARGTLNKINVLAHNETGSVVAIEGESIRFTVMVSNQPNVTDTTEHRIIINDTTYSWKGFLAVEQETK